MFLRLHFPKGERPISKKFSPAGLPAGAPADRKLGDRFATERPREGLVNFLRASARGSVRLAILLKISKRLKNS